MVSRRMGFTTGLVWVIWLAGVPVLAQSPKEPITPTSAPLPLDDMTPEMREHVRAVLDRPTLRSHGPVEAFTCQPIVYDWLLDHPELAVRLWRLLGARCADILLEGENRYLWKDGQSKIHWDTALKGPGLRIWYAEGEVHPGVLLPHAPVKAVAVLRYMEIHDSAGKPAIRHQVEMILHTDSHAVALAARILGASVPHLAEQFVGQIEMFYGALAWYLEQHPRHAEALFTQLKQPASTDVPIKPVSAKSGG